MDFFKKKLGELKETIIEIIDDLNLFEYKREDSNGSDQLLGELCEHLRQIGLNVALLEPDSPEGFKSPSVIGCVKIEGRNLDLILVQLGIVGEQDLSLYHYYYVVLGKIEGFEDKLHADFKSDWHDRCSLRPDFERIDKALITKEVTSSRWKGGELAQLLNADSDLTCALYSEGLDQLKIRPDGRRCVKILHPHQRKNRSWRDMCSGDITFWREVHARWSSIGSEGPTVYQVYTVGRKQFPTREAFEAYDKIAHHIRDYVGFKFCMYCELKIPKEAQFCPKCGEKQS